MANPPTKRPGPFAQDLSREPPSKDQREKDYGPEKKATGSAIKRQPERDAKDDADLQDHKGDLQDDLGFPRDDESKWG